jgi:hypothetical protein
MLGTPGPMDAPTRHRSLQNRADAVSHTTASIFFLIRKAGTERLGEVQSRFLRFYVASDIPFPRLHLLRS